MEKNPQTNNRKSTNSFFYYAKAVIWGFFADVFLKFVLSFLILIVISNQLMGAGMSEQEFVKYVLNPPLNSPLFISISIAGIISTIFGGFIAGRVAKVSEIMLATILAGINSAMSIFVFLFGPPFPFVLFLLLLLINFYATIQGGSIAKKIRLNNLNKL